MGQMEEKREILFRARHIHAVPQNKHLDGTWTEGYLSGKSFIFELESEIEVLIAPETVCQYTGVSDKNGKKIFEGDIFKYHFNESIIGIVRYGEYKNPFNDDEHTGHVGFYIEWLERSDMLRMDLGYWAKVSEVIGNIFDNPELVKKA